MVVGNAAEGVLPTDEQILGGSDLETAHLELACLDNTPGTLAGHGHVSSLR